MKTILITGSNGLLGQKLVYRLLQIKKYKVVACSRGENRLLNREGYIYESVDITKEEQVKKVLEKHLPSVIIHTAAMTNVDACELEKDTCTKNNVDAVSYLVKCSQQIIPSVHFIHLSTDFIFDGTSGPYKEEDLPNPLSHYAWSKLDAEKIVMSSQLKWTILRTVLVYGVADSLSRSNIVLWAKQALESKKNINVVDDQFRTPTLAEDLAEGCLLAAEKEAQGVYNISGKDFMSILELVYRVADFFELDRSLINPSTSDGIKQPAQRPPRTGFIIDKAVKELGYNPHSFEEGLAIVSEQLPA